MQVQLQAVILRNRAEAIADIIDQIIQRHAALFDGDAAALQAGKLQLIIDQAGQAHDLAQDNIIIAHPVGLLGNHAFLQRFDQRAHGGERRAQLMRYVGNIFAARALQPFRLRNIGKQTHRARDRADFIHDRADGDPDGHIAGCDIAGDGLTAFDYGIEVLPHGFIRQVFHSRIRQTQRNLLLFKQIGDGGVRMRDQPFRIDGDNALGKSVQHML